MEIYLLRHGIAETHAASDAERDLTEEGRQKVHEVMRVAARAGVAPSLILSSPYSRALATAKIAAGALGYKSEILLSQALLPEARCRGRMGRDPRPPPGRIAAAGGSRTVIQRARRLPARDSGTVDRFQKGRASRDRNGGIRNTATRCFEVDVDGETRRLKRCLERVIPDCFSRSRTVSPISPDEGLVLSFPIGASRVRLGKNPMKSRALGVFITASVCLLAQTPQYNPTPTRAFGQAQLAVRIGQSESGGRPGILSSAVDCVR